MRNIELDTGIEEFSFQGGGVLRFNPSDPNLYARFLEAEEKMKALEADLRQKAKELGDATEASIALSRQADRQAKDLLNWVFGGENDFDKLLSGVSLLAMTGNGKHLVTNLMDALETILTAGAARFAEQKAEAIRTAR